MSWGAVESGGPSMVIPLSQDTQRVYGGVHAQSQIRQVQ